MYGSLPLLCGTCKSFCDFIKRIGELYIGILSFTMTVCQHKDKFIQCQLVQLFTELDVAHWFVHGAFSGLLFNR